MKRTLLAFFFLLQAIALTAQTAAPYREMNRPTSNFVGPMLPAPPERLIQVVFALDATGSMSGLIGTAKEKIWSITSGLAQAEYTRVEIGLVFYRDRGDEFITKQIPISIELDDVYEELMKIRAAGGGDMEESVNQGLYESIMAMNWSKDTSAFKSIFLVGDCPPHMDYQDDVKYPESCKLAKANDIVINTILMGYNKTTEKIWKEISACAEGEYIQTGMNANNLTITTPYDDSIAVISGQLDDTRIYYGDMKYKQEFKKVQSAKFKKDVTTTSNARRAEYYNSKTGKEVYYGKNEMLNDIKAKKIALDTIQKELLPDTMANMNLEQRKAYAAKLSAQRDSLDAKMTDLVKKRNEYINESLKTKNKTEVENSFDNKVFKSVQKQAERKDIKIKGETKY